MIKTWAMLGVAVVAAIYAALTDGGIDQQEWIVIAGTAVGSFGVYIVPNMDVGLAHFAKGAVSFLTAGLAVLYVVVQGGLTQAEVIEVVLAACAAIGLTTGLENKGYVFAVKRPTVGQAVASGEAGTSHLT
jgi:hypothetical protein